MFYNNLNNKDKCLKIQKHDDGISVKLHQHITIQTYTHSTNLSTNDLFKKSNSYSYYESYEYQSIDERTKIKTNESEKKKEKINFYCSNGVLKTLHLGFIDHQGVELRADNFWLLILQGIGIYEEKTGMLGKMFELPDKEKKKKIIIRKDEFKMGSKENDWTSVFKEFEMKIKENMPEELYNLIAGKRFTTTTQMDEICYSIVLMDCLKDYYSYYVATSCYIPEIKLKGTKKDWEDLVEHTKMLSSYFHDLDWWFETIIPVLKQFVLLFDNQADELFWNSIYKFRNSSGGPCVTGYISLFFPYTLDYQGKEFIENRTIQRSRRECTSKKKKKDEVFISDVIYPYYPTPSYNFPNGLSNVGFVWDYYGKQHDYKMIGGFFGCKQIKGGWITPSLGYAIGKSSSKD